MSGSGAPPVVPTQFQTLDIGSVDRKWQKTFTIVWASVLGFFIIISIPRLLRSIWNGATLKSIKGITEDWKRKQYQALSVRKNEARKGRRVEVAIDKLSSVLWWSIPGFELDLGQVLVIIAYIVVVIVCIVTDAALVRNANRAGYIAVAQLPIVFLFAAKNSVLSLLLGPGYGYEKLNYVHKWSGRGIFIAGLLHGSLWIRDHLDYGSPIIGEFKETTGIAAFSIMCVIVITSIRPVRRMFYEIFSILHVLSFVSFFIVLCYHTPYATPWIFPPLAFYGLDLLLRMFRLRIKDAVLVPANKQMTLIHVQDCTDGWTAGQHVRLRVFFSGRIFESHPLTMFTAPPEVTCVTAFPEGVNLGARVMGDWTRALNEYATRTVEEIQKQEEVCEDEKPIKGSPASGPAQLVTAKRTASTSLPPDVPVQVMIDGPYGGCSLDLGRYESVLLFAGGAGATFTLGLLDDIVGRCVKLGRRGGEITKRIEFAWCIRSFGAIDWFAPALMDIANKAAHSDLSLHISVYVTCLCNPEAVPPIPNCDVTIVRPSIYKVLLDLVTPPSDPSPSECCASGSTPVVEAVETSAKLHHGDVIQVVARTSAKDTTTKRPDTATTRTTTSYSDDDDRASDADAEAFDPSVRNRLPWLGVGGGLAVCASGPESLTREAANAVARLQLLRKDGGVGIIGLHTEVFSL